MIAVERLAALDGEGRALLEASMAMGFSEEVARAGLKAEFDAWTPAAISRVMGELGQAHYHRIPRTVLIIAARTLPASALRQVLFARLLDAHVLFKPATEQEALAHALARVDPYVEPCIFEGNDASSLHAAVARADAVVVLGSDQTVAAVREAVPGSKAFAGYGHRLSVACLFGRPSQEVMDGLAQDICAWDQAGCLSPQVLWTDSDVDEVAQQVTRAVASLEGDLPMRVDSEVQTARYAMTTLTDMVGRLYRSRTALVAAIPTSRFRASPGARSLWVLPWAAEALSEIGHLVSTVGWGGQAPEPIPGVRYCRFGQMQRPPLDWQHDGKPNLLPMLIPPS